MFRRAFGVDHQHLAHHSALLGTLAQFHSPIQFRLGPGRHSNPHVQLAQAEVWIEVAWGEANRGFERAERFLDQQQACLGDAQREKNIR